MVYEWGTKAKSTVIVTELTTKDGHKITVAIHAENKLGNLEVNEIASIHGKAAERFLSEMENAKEGGLQEALRYVEKEKALDWLGIAPPMGAAQANQGLNSTAKVIQEFENPKLPAEKSRVSPNKFPEIQKEEWTGLIDNLKESGLAKDVITDKELYDKEFGKHEQKFTDKKGEVYGFVTSDGTVYLNPEKMNANTPIHEFGHLWNSFIKENNPELYKKGAELIKQSEYWKKVNDDPNYADLSEEAKIDEAMATAIGDKGEKMKHDILSFARLKTWLKEMWEWLGSKLGIRGLNSNQIQDLTLDKFTSGAVADLMSGKKIGNNSKNGIAKQSDYNFDVTGVTKANAADMRAIKDTAVTNGTFMKAPNGKPTKLNERQWLQVRTKAFQEWFGNWEDSAKYDYLLSEDYVSTITGNEFQKDETPLTDKVTKYYLEKYNGEVEREGLGVVELSREGVKDSLAHGIGKTKSAAYAAVPEIIKDGIIIDHQPNWKGRGKDTYVIAAPVKIGNEGYVGIVIVTQSTVKNKFYLYEVVLQKNLRNGFKTFTKEGSPLGDFAKVIQNLETAKNNSSKVVDENGEPMPVYHFTGNKGFNIFDKQRLGERTEQNDVAIAATAELGFWFNNNIINDNEILNQIKNKNFEVKEVFLNIQDARVEKKLRSLIDKLESYIIEPQILETEDEDGLYMPDYEYQKPKDLANEYLEIFDYKDGIIVEDDTEFGGKSFVAFSPNQIKSATDNNGNFDEAKNDIRFQIAEEQEPPEKPSAIEHENEKFIQDQLNPKPIIDVCNFVMFFFVMVLILVSGLFTPVNSMPQWAQAITVVNPLKYFMEVMRAVYLKGSGIIELLPQFFALCGFAVFFNRWAVASYKKSR
jgi:hypothetical protein